MDLQRLIMASDYKLLDVLPALGWDTGQEVGTGGREAGQDTLTRSLQMAFGGGGKSGGQGLPDVLRGSPWAKRAPGSGAGLVGGWGGAAAPPGR